MDRISINLLPVGLKESKQLLKKKKLINLISISVLGILVVITGVLVVLSVIQNRQVSSETAELSSFESTISSLKEREAAAVILKKRLGAVSTIIKQKYPQTDSFLLVTSLLPEQVSMQVFTTDQANMVSLQGNSPDAASLQKFFDNLTDPKINEGKITQTEINNLNRGTSPQLGFDLKITTKTGGSAK